MYLHNLRIGQRINGSVVVEIIHFDDGRIYKGFRKPWFPRIGTRVECRCLGCNAAWTFHGGHNMVQPFACPTCYRRTKIAWHNMKARCLNELHPDYENYGQRGIGVCYLWQKSFTEFVNHVGFNPGGGLTLDRVENEGNYEPGNARWATRKQQANNRRKPKCRSRDF